jgi:hypothetical protein
VAFRAGNNQKMQVFGVVVDELMNRSGFDVTSFPGANGERSASDQHGANARQDIEKLGGAFVKMFYFNTIRGDTLADNAEVFTILKVPAVAIVSPRVMFSIFQGNNICHKISIILIRVSVYSSKEILIPQFVFVWSHHALPKIST